MSQITSLGTWTSRRSTQTVGDNLVAIHIPIAAGDLTNADDGTVWANGEHCGLCELPFGSIVLECVVKLTAAAGGTCTGQIGVHGFTALAGSTFTDSGASTGQDADGLATASSCNLNATTVQRGDGALLGVPLGSSVFSDSDESGKPLYVTLEAVNLTTSAALCAGSIYLLVQTP